MNINKLICSDFENGPSFNLFLVATQGKTFVVKQEMDSQWHHEFETPEEQRAPAFEVLNLKELEVERVFRNKELELFIESVINNNEDSCPHSKIFREARYEQRKMILK